MHLRFYILLVLLALQCFSLPAIAVAPSRAKLQALLNEGEQGELSHNLRQAEVNYHSALKEAEKFGPGSAEIQECEARLAAVYVLQGRLQEAEPHYLKAKSIAVDLRKDGKDHPESLVWLDDLSDAYQLQSASMQPEYCLVRCIAIRKMISPRHKNLAQAETHYGAHLMGMGRIAEGEKFLLDAYARCRTLNGAESQQLAMTGLVVANSYWNIHRTKEAEKYCAESVSIIKKRLGTTTPMLANVQRLHCNFLTNLGRYEEALAEINQALVYHKKVYGANTAEYAYDLASMAEVHMNLHKLPEADSESRQALAIFEKHPDGILPYRLVALNVAAKVARMQHRNAAATAFEAELKKLEGKKH